MPYLKEDIFSHLNPSRLYARAGQEVKTFGDGDPVMVETVSGNRFYVLKTELTDEQPGSCSAQETAKLPPPKSPSGHKPRKGSSPGPAIAQPDQGSLF